MKKEELMRLQTRDAEGYHGKHEEWSEMKVVTYSVESYCEAKIRWGFGKKKKKSTWRP